MGLCPAAGVLIWLCGLVSLALVDVGVLASLTGALLVLGLGWAPEQSRTLIRRSRWLLLSILVFFSWGTPGEALWHGWPSGPTHEGLHHALHPLLRLVSAVLMVALLLRAWSPQALISAFYALARPLGCVSRLGISRERMAVRLMLVLAFAQAKAVPDWKAALLGELAGAASPSGAPTPSAIRLIPMQWRWFDGLALAAAVACVGWAGGVWAAIWAVYAPLS